MSKLKSTLLSLIVAFCAASSACGQSLTGEWSGDWRVLDNGEHDRMILDLHQSGNQLSGTVVTIGHVWHVKGIVTGIHFEIYLSPKDARPKVIGDIIGNQLHLVRDSVRFIASPASARDHYSTIQRLDPPTIRTVPYNGLATTPPMGWNSWNLFQGRIDDHIVREIADEMVESGMRDAGYVYLNIDDTWEGVRDAQGNLGSNRKFPDMKKLADYVHSKGLKFGLYSSPGPRTCEEYPGSYGHEIQDANTFAAWGVDFLKYDWCGAKMVYRVDELRSVYQHMGEALLASGRPVVYSICEYGDGGVETWGAKVGGNLWRTTGDIDDSWSKMIANIERQVPAADFAGPGHWNDPDMLEIGNGHMTEDEYRTHMSLWAISAAPLLAGNDIRTMTPQTKALLMNAEVIAVDQDSLGSQATPRKSGAIETWVKPLADGSVAVAVVNLGTTGTSAVMKISDFGLNGKVFSARDLWAHTDVTFEDGVYSAKVPSHGVVMLRVRSRD
jgi:alpha-galactosidase